MCLDKDREIEKLRDKLKKNDKDSDAIAIVDSVLKQLRDEYKGTAKLLESTPKSRDSLITKLNQIRKYVTVLKDIQSYDTKQSVDKLRYEKDKEIESLKRKFEEKEATLRQRIDELSDNVREAQDTNREFKEHLSESKKELAESQAMNIKMAKLLDKAQTREEKRRKHKRRNRRRDYESESSQSSSSDSSGEDVDQLRDSGYTDEGYDDRRSDRISQPRDVRAKEPIPSTSASAGGARKTQKKPNRLTGHTRKTESAKTAREPHVTNQVIDGGVIRTYRESAYKESRRGRKY